MRRFSPLAAAGWSTTWAVGAGIGVALGAYLTVLGAAATPGDTSLDMTELAVLPAITAGVVFVLSFVGRLLFSLASGVFASRPSDHSRGDDQSTQHDHVG